MRIWKKGEYHRLSVDRDLRAWCGWEKWNLFLNEIPNLLTRDLVAVEFTLMGRAKEALNAELEMFKVHKKYTEVIGLPVQKRYKKLGVQLVCKECGTVNEPRETVCARCKANLIMCGRRKFLTEKIDMTRIPFWFPNGEAQMPFVLARISSQIEAIQNAPKEVNLDMRHWLFPELHDKPRSGRGDAYNLIRKIDPLIQKYLDVPHGWNHLFVALRGHCLGEEYDMDELEIKNFSSRVKSETVGRYVKKRLSYGRKMGIMPRLEKKALEAQ
jgi:hypothetical protein